MLHYTSISHSFFIDRFICYGVMSHPTSFEKVVGEAMYDVGNPQRWEDWKGRRKG